MKNQVTLKENNWVQLSIDEASWSVQQEFTNSEMIINFMNSLNYKLVKEFNVDKIFVHNEL